MKFNSTVRRVLIVVGLATFGIAYAEAFVRLFDPQPIMPRYVTATPYGIRGNIPNARYRHSTPEVNVEFRINAQGMRADREYPITKPTHTCRIALFGDSFFMGYELNYEDTFAYRLEHELQEQGFQAEVLNFSVSGYGTSEMLRSYENVGRRFDPDVILFQWHSTDPDDNVRADLYRLDNGELQPTGNSYLPSIAVQDRLLNSNLYRLIADNSHLYNALRNRVAKATKKVLATIRGALHSPVRDTHAAPAVAEDDEDDAERPATAYGKTLSAALLNYSRTLVESEGRRFLVVEMPVRASRTVFRSSLAELNPDDISHINVISPLEAFEQIASPELKLYTEHGQGHITPRAVEVLVAVSVAKLAGTQSLERCAAGRTAHVKRRDDGVATSE